MVSVRMPSDFVGLKQAVARFLVAYQFTPNDKDALDEADLGFDTALIALGVLKPAEATHFEPDIAHHLVNVSTEEGILQIRRNGDMDWHPLHVKREIPASRCIAPE